MSKQLFLITLLISGIIHQSPDKNCKPIPFTSTTAVSPPIIITSADPGFISVNATIQHNKFIIDWKVKNNQMVDQFKVEKSTDGVNFNTAALVFGTDKDSADQYQFYEKAGSQKFIYRILLITKNKASVYSEQLEINPSN